MKSLGLLFLFFAIFFYKLIFYGEVFYCCDNLLINIPAKILWAKSILTGNIPFWNPYLFSGSTFLADINLSPLYPGNIFFLFWEPFRALTLSILVHIFFAAIGMYWVSLKLGYNRQSAMIAACIFIFSGTIVGYTGNLPMIQVVSFLPWVFGSWVLFTQQRNKRMLGFVVLFSALQLVAGHVQLTFYTFLFCFIYGFIFIQGTILKKVSLLGIIGIIIIFVTGIQLIPFLDFARNTTRIGQEYSYSVFGALPFSAVLRFMLPSSVGDLSNGTDWWQGGSVYGYIGVIPLILSLFSFKKANKREHFFLITGIISFLAAFGSSTPIFPILYRIIPGISLFRVPSHFLLLSTFCFSLLSAKGYELIDTALDKKTRDRVGHLLFILSSISIFVAAGLFVIKSEHVIGLLQNIHYQKIQNKLELLGESGVFVILQSISKNILLIGVELFILGICIRFLKKQRWVLILGIISLDLFIYSRMNLLTVPYTQIKSWQQQQSIVVSELKKHMQPGFLTYVHPSLYPSPHKKTFGKKWMEEEINWQMQTFRPNLLMNHEIPIVDGYASMIDNRYQNIFSTTVRDPTGVNIPDSAVDQLRMLGVRYIILPKNVSEKNILLPNLNLLFKNEDISMYELHTTLKIALFNNISGENFMIVGGILSLVGIIVFMLLPEHLLKK